MLSARLAASVARNLPRTAQQVSEIKANRKFSHFFSLGEMENCITIFRLLGLK
jgi:hypothetical protein